VVVATASQNGIHHASAMTKRSNCARTNPLRDPERNLALQLGGSVEIAQILARRDVGGG